ncbi:pyridoxamine 5'-phosphate oxidase family protein [Streptomyces caniscabiei]|uniref:pyridoxamine 5'-phosphate oxidase family protein n=1 Tax=Streptomyces caniscabiei TaxID=2746961 RepID=UPI0029A250F9|nr:pyridoxamine 5'-phosphate oxidase family protein [Streptomyces caniscabiei]MDX2776587.1 pyridoxamine 5'-phosphate oxidase family protein [Streptomyces caniscabiei]
MAKIESETSQESQDQILEFLQSHASGVLVTADASANPYGAVVFYTVNDDFSIQFATKSETQKFKNIEQNAQVAFVCYDETTQTSLQLNGNAEIIQDPAEKEKVIHNMHLLSDTTSRSNMPPTEKLYAGEYQAVRIMPRVIKLAVFVRPDVESNEDIYEVLTFSS